MTMLLWMAVVLLLAVGLAGTVLPALPGTAFILAGIVLAAWIDERWRTKDERIDGLLGRTAAASP